jgi:hypothetical protein
LLTRIGDNFGVDELNEVALLNFNYNDATENSNLRRGKSNALCGSHGLSHIVEEAERFGSYFFYGTAFLAQNLVTDFNNL